MANPSNVIFKSDLQDALNNELTKVQIIMGRHVVTGYMVGDFTGGGQNNWASLFETGAAQSASATANAIASGVNALIKAAGGDGFDVPQVQLMSPQQTAVQWVGSSRPRFGVTMYFVATTPSDKDDPRVRVSKLLEAVYPTTASIDVTKTSKASIMLAPLGYSLRGTNGAAGTVGLKIGNWFYAVNKLLINSVNYTFSKEVTANAWPLYAKVDIQFEAYRVLQINEVKAFFLNAATTGTGLTNDGPTGVIKSG